jgi:hypothetical protein
MSKTADVRRCTETQDGHYPLQVWLYGHGLLIVPSLNSAEIGQRVKIAHKGGGWVVQP